MPNQFLEECYKRLFGKRTQPAINEEVVVDPHRSDVISLNRLEGLQALFYAISIPAFTTFLPSMENIERAGGPPAINGLQVLYVGQALLSLGRGLVARATSSDAYPTRLLEMSTQAVASLLMIAAFISVTVARLSGDDPEQHDRDIAGMAKEDLALGGMLLLDMVSNIGHNFSDIRSRCELAALDTERAPLVSGHEEHRSVSLGEMVSGLARSTINLVTTAGFGMVLATDHDPENAMRETGAVITVMGLSANALLTALRLFARLQRRERSLDAFRRHRRHYGSVQQEQQAEDYITISGDSILGSSEAVVAASRTEPAASAAAGESVAITIQPQDVHVVEQQQAGTNQMLTAPADPTASTTLLPGFFPGSFT